MKSKLIIIGAGGHGKVVAEAAMTFFNVLGFADDKTPIGREIINGIKVIGSVKEIKKMKTGATHFIVAIGNNETRKNIFNNTALYLKAATLIHPSAVISENARIG